MTMYKKSPRIVCSLMAVLYLATGCSKSSQPINESEIANSVWEKTDQGKSGESQWFFRENGTLMNTQGVNAFKGNWKLDENNPKVLLLELAIKSGRIARYTFNKNTDGLLVTDGQYPGVKSLSMENICLKRLPGSPAIP